jgi:hypothetical protein
VILTLCPIQPLAPLNKPGGVLMALGAAFCADFSRISADAHTHPHPLKVCAHHTLCGPAQSVCAVSHHVARYTTHRSHMHILPACSHFGNAPSFPPVLNIGHAHAHSRRHQPHPCSACMRARFAPALALALAPALG